MEGSKKLYQETWKRRKGTATNEEGEADTIDGGDISKRSSIKRRNKIDIGGQAGGGGGGG